MLFVLLYPTFITYINSLYSFFLTHPKGQICLLSQWDVCGFFSPSLKLQTGINWDVASLHCHKTTVTFTYHCRSVWMELGGSNVKTSVCLRKRGREMIDFLFCLQWHHHCGLEHLFNLQYLTSSIQYSGAHIRNSGIAYLLDLESNLFYLLCGSGTESTSHCRGNSFIAEQDNKIVRASFVLSVFFFLFFLLLLLLFLCHGIWKLPDGCLVERKFVKVLEEMEEPLAEI